MDTRLDRTAVQAQVEFACLRSPGVEFLCERLLTRRWRSESAPGRVREHEQLAGS